MASPLAAQDLELALQEDSLSLTYRKRFGADIAVEISNNLVSWFTIQAEEEVTAIDSGGETIISSWAIDAVPRQLFFRLRAASAWSVTLAWDAPLDHSISGYILRYGTASKSYTQEIDVSYNTQATICVPKSISVCYFVVTAYNPAGLESSPSNELMIDLH